MMMFAILMIVTTTWETLAHDKIEDPKDQERESPNQGLFSENADGGEVRHDLACGHVIDQYDSPCDQCEDLNVEEKTPLSFIVMIARDRAVIVRMVVIVAVIMTAASPAWLMLVGVGVSRIFLFSVRFHGGGGG